MRLPGLHHITAIASNAKRNVDFYTRVLGLRLVKKTVNFDDPGTYHLYYGDHAASPGTLLTFFLWDELPRGQAGTGMTSAIAWSVPAGALGFWRERLQAQGVTVDAPLPGTARKSWPSPIRTDSRSNSWQRPNPIRACPRPIRRCRREKVSAVFTV